jgi:type II secretory pathway component GspD/PulD (secretin)
VKSVLFSLILLSISTFAADKKMKMNFNNEEITKIIEAYSKASEQTFIIDPGVRGRVSIINAESVELAEAYNQLSSALALNGYGISKQENTFIVRPARNIQRDLIEVTSEVPALKPERMVSWIVTFKNMSAKNVIREMRNLTSKDGEISMNAQSNQIVITDWSSNLNKIAELFKQLDKPADPKLSKLIEQNKKAD